MEWLIWKLPSWAHELILKLTGYRLVLYYEEPPVWLHPYDLYYELWTKTIQKCYLRWTKQWPLS